MHSQFFECFSENLSSSHEDITLLYESSSRSWEEIKKLAPTLPRGWYEHSHLSNIDRVEFIRDFWLNTLPYVPHVHDNLKNFFDKLDDIGVFIAKQKKKETYESFMVYSLNEGKSYYQGMPGVSLKVIEKKKLELDYSFPDDYLNFFRIHSGFRKNGSEIFPLDKLNEERDSFVIKANQKGVSYLGKPVDPLSLFPFSYFLEDCYQCFYNHWYTPSGKGNVSCSISKGQISDFQKDRSQSFTSFSHFLINYLEKI